ncbi:MAG: ADP-ribosylglycohydrolase family protein, partial [Lachnospiraceae bacterium]
TSYTWQSEPHGLARGSSQVVETLEAALWSLLNTDNYRDCILKAVNLGHDTDTVAAVAGGLAGLAYGLDGIPASWLESLKGKNIIDRCCKELEQRLMDERM